MLKADLVDYVVKLTDIRANKVKLVLDKAINLLEELNKEGLFSALEKGVFADIKRSREGGKGLDGVVVKGNNYTNPFIQLFKKR